MTLSLSLTLPLTPHLTPTPLNNPNPNPNPNSNPHPIPTRTLTLTPNPTPDPNQVNLLDAPLVAPGRGGNGGTRAVGGKRGREERGGAAGDGVSVDEASGRLVVRDDAGTASAGDTGAG